MFVHECTVCGERRLTFTSQVTGIENTPSGIVVTHTCWCGAEQTWTTGNGAGRRHLAAA
jgi:hypothetical protein